MSESENPRIPLSFVGRRPEKTMKTDEKGLFTFMDVEAGRYELKVGTARLPVTKIWLPPGDYYVKAAYRSLKAIRWSLIRSRAACSEGLGTPGIRLHRRQ
jgi:hypothetical protein